MNYAFVDSAEAIFDPASFRLPAELEQSRGPEPEPLEAGPALRVLTTQLAREAARPAPDARVSQNLRQQVQLNASDARAEQLKPELLKLKALDANSPAEALRTALLAALATLQACYRAEHVPKDLATMSVLHPLLKCQAHKWDALTAGQPLTPPAPEAALLQKLRQLKSGLGLVERAALMQLILAINQHLPAMTSLSEPAADPAIATSPEGAAGAPAAPGAPGVPTEASPLARPGVVSPVVSSTASCADAESDIPFDPIQASRLSLQLRAKLQRTHSEAEKTAIQGQLQAIERQQAAYFQGRQAQALQKQIQEFALDTARFAQGRLTAAQFESWRKLRLTSLQTMARLFAQSRPQAAVARFESGQAQLARLGVGDARDWIAAERRRLGEDAGCLPGQQPELQAWQQAFDALLDAALDDLARLGLQLRQAEVRKQLDAITRAQADWEARSAALRQLEAEYLAGSDEAQSQLSRQKLLQAYAELMATLPAIPQLEL